jgi:HAMP domain-containing protein
VLDEGEYARISVSYSGFEIGVLIESNDEIGELGESFNIMRGKIKEQIET